MNNIDILEELKEWFNNFDLDSIKHKPEEYIQAISTLIAENKDLKEMLKHRIESEISYLKQKYDLEEDYINYETVIEILQELLGKE